MKKHPTATTLLRLALALVLSLVIAGCDSKKRAKDNAPESQKEKEPLITASPNPVPAGEGDGKTTISWDTGDGSVVDVYLSVDDGPEKLFGRHSKNSIEAPWIGAGPVYEFRLYAGEEHKKMLGSVKVTRSKK